MSRVSAQPALPGAHDQEHASAASLPMDVDPSSFFERAPALASLLPDEALSLALARGDALAVHAALTARLARESAGPTQETLRELLANRALFVVAERPPSLSSFLGTGIALTGLPPAQQQETPFIASRAVCLFGVPVWPLGEHLARRGRDGQLEVLGRVAAATGSRGAQWAGLLAVGGLALASAGLALVPFVSREVQVVNGLSRPVEVLLDGRNLTLNPGEMVQEQVYSLGGPYYVEAKWVGRQKPFEVLSLESTQRAVYNILGAASLSAEDPSARNAGRQLEARTGSLSSAEEVRWQGGWEHTVREAVNEGKWSEAAQLARAVFLADPTVLRAGEQAALLLARHQPSEALVFAWELQRNFPDDPASGRLAQDIFLALGQRAEAFTLYSALAQQAPLSLTRALLAARVAPPDELRAATFAVQARFPEAPEALRAAARIRLADRAPVEALELLDKARSKTPEALEDVELRVRAMLSQGQLTEASSVLRKFAEDPRHGSWELALLGGRLGRMTGPSRAQYVTRDLIPVSLTGSAERMAAFALLTGEGTVSDKELKTLTDPVAQEVIALTRTVLKDWEKAVQQVSAASDKAVSRLDPETAAMLGLERSRLGDAQGADRLFGVSLSLMAAREPLETYVRSGELRPDFLLLPPGLQAAAYLVRARAVPQSGTTDRGRARAVDVLGGLARRALDAGYQEHESPTRHFEPWTESTHRWGSGRDLCGPGIICQFRFRSTE